MKASAGLTLIEIIIALSILSIGVLAAASLQGSALSASNRARVIQEVTNTARTEVERQRQFARTGTGPAAASPGCLSTAPAGYTCTVTVVPCRIVSNALSCGTGTAPVVADQVTVTVVGPQASSVELQTVVAR